MGLGDCLVCQESNCECYSRELEQKLEALTKEAEALAEVIEKYGPGDVWDRSAINRWRKFRGEK